MEMEHHISKQELNGQINQYLYQIYFIQKKYINHLNYDEYLKSKLQEAIDQYDPISTENIMNEAIKKDKKEIKEDEELGRNTNRLKNRLKKIENTKTYLMNQWSGIEAHDKYKDKLTDVAKKGKFIIHYQKE